MNNKLVDVIEFDCMVKFPEELILVFEIVTRVILVILSPIKEDDFVGALANERLVIERSISTFITPSKPFSRQISSCFHNPL